MESVEVYLEARLERVALHHPSAQAAAGELQADLQSQARLRSRERHVAAPGTKGATVDVVVTLASSGAVGALVKVLKLWLNRDRRRSVTVTLQNGSDRTVITVEGDPISIGTLSDALSAAVGVEETKDPN